MPAPPPDTIAAIATPPGRGGIGVVRVSGTGLADMARHLTGTVPAPRRAVRAVFLDAAGCAIDDGLILFFPAPHSYTGEDVLELHGHGGPVVMRLLLARCLELGARPAEPGEFTRRAFLNDKLDLAQAEAVADLIDAASEAAARSALRSLRGEFSRVVGQLVDELIELRALVEATLDFPEEEIDPAERADALRRLDRLSAHVKRATEQARAGSILRTGLTVVLAGQPNVGKSSLLNRLAGEELAIVTAIPGTTRDTVRQSIQIDGVPIHLIDTAGLREPADEVEAIGMRRTWEAIERADLLLLVVDARAGVTATDEEIVARLPPRLRRITIFNKTDLLDAPPAGGDDALYVSALTGYGLEHLSRALLDAAGWQPGGEDVFMARERHLHALGRASDRLAQARKELDRMELFAEELRLAQNELSSITGEFTADDLLGAIFERFCIGK